MTGFLLDENLPERLRFSPSQPVIHVRDLGSSLTDSDVWNHAKTHDLVIVTKDADFSDATGCAFADWQHASGGISCVSRASLACD
jgi:predicted nuclease of predicted toxin-antitoxin system